ncbi:S8 family serine peptidase [Catelliglobosispora koreensis]|uniref:S8 family serine peptidase n=1 Tax=Catelliglobosispora koreensis TaxID=129052 RepID=UPI0003A0835C
MANPRMLGLGIVSASVLALAMVGAPAQAAEGTILHAGGATAVADSYIVVFKDATVSKADVGGVAQRLVRKHGGSITHTYSTALRGFAVNLPEAAAKQLAADPAVQFVEQNHTVTIQGTQTPTPSWGLDRIDQRDLPLNNSYTYPNTGSGVRAYILDTGIRITHQDFGGRASHGRDTVDNDNDATDCHGHGTHVAGTVAGGAYGVAKGASLVAVRVLNCQGSGSFAGIVAGVDWVTANAVKPAVANMSLGGTGTNAALETAVTNSINSGVVYALAAGNSNADACNFTPARTPAAITVGATESNDARASYSNFGTCLDIFAPGSGITSAWFSSDTATNTISGTSMASPHVAGVAALILSANPGWTAQQVRDRMVADSTPNKVTNPGTGSPNRLLYVVNGPPGNQPPVASFTHNCGTGSLSCTFNGSGSSDPDGTIASYAWNFGDGTTGTGATVSHTFAAAGSYTVTLTVTDNGGATGSTSQNVSVGQPPSNLPPVAAFTASCQNLFIWRFCTFDGTGSSDPDGTIASYAWNFGDGSSGTGATTTKIYTGTGTRTVTLTVTDNGGATDTETKPV